ncbi:conserved domain protein [Streptococcus porcinus str. Jelinkova 176]|uniref:Uncharacterized protein n=2 Tax=Streptococcus porcinus TaxID=1340 RepID=A0A4V0H2K6_STRPO|nr:conserved domain protein [Streptococcus porcinus str. Jelinkova 176]SQG42718.1 Uncharacterised protein [Streptococcus porcinus]VTT41737.1 Uncharacterised protein [Streptococcus porcinus]VTT42883.1 Uncharacterised protein [Streptococcus porcinus]
MGLHFQNASLNDIICVTDIYASILRSIYIHLLDETKNEWFEREKLSGGQTGGQTNFLQAKKPYK